MRSGVTRSRRYSTTLTDTYSLSGQDPPTAPYTAPTSTTRVLPDPHGNSQLNPNGGGNSTSADNTILLAENPTEATTSRTVQVGGYWQIKGAYLTFRTGPTFQIPVTERIKLSIGFGAAMAFVGSTFKTDEEIVVDDVTSPITYVDEKTLQVLLPAFYADADAEYWLTERSGLYLGATYQKSKSFGENLGSESATVNLGTTSGLQSGFTLRF